MVLIGQNYVHYKGGEYQILALAKHSESLEELVIYQDRNNPEKVWARPIALFLSSVEIEGELKPRFLLQ